jgi:hypothetical protein
VTVVEIKAFFNELHYHERTLSWPGNPESHYLNLAEPVGLPHCLAAPAKV